MKKTAILFLAALLMMLLTACSTQKNTAKTRWWHSFTARYNTYYNGSQAFIDGSLDKENGNKDNFTELIPLYTVGNKQSRTLGSSNFDRAIEKSEKAIKLHSIKRRPEWTKNRRKTPKDMEWLSRREYNPFLWHAWLLLGKSQFQKGEFDEAAATFFYMSRLYQSQPAINGLARAWLAKSYVEMDWLYDAEDVIRKMQRDSIHYRAQKDWDYTYADYYIRAKQYEEAIPYLRKVIRHERHSKQRAREWFLMGQLQTLLGNREQAYKAYQHVIRQNPPYELEFNARIAQTEVMAVGNAKKMISKLRRMARSDNNKDYLDQVYYAIGNIYLTQNDTTHAISAYEEGNRKATRSGIEKGVLLLKLGDLYWEKEKYNDAQRCYGEAIGLLDKDRPDYQQLSRRSKVLDELVPFTDDIHLQDSLQVLAKLPEAERNKAIDRVIEELIKQEKEEKRRQEEAEAERIQQEQSAIGNRQQQRQPTQAPTTDKQGTWYFYNPTAVSQGKQTFQQQWGRRENTDDWQRVNKTVVRMNTDEEAEDTDSEGGESDGDDENTSDEKQEAAEKDTAAQDSAALDPHKREYYLAQIPFTDEQVAASNEIIMNALFNSGVIFKDKLDNLRLSEKQFLRLTNDYPDYNRMDETWYHLFLLYSRMGRQDQAQHCLDMLTADYADSPWAILLNDPYYAENQRFGVHLEDSLYAATYDAFKADRHDEVTTNTRLSKERFPLGANRAKFIFIDGLSQLNNGNVENCLTNMQEVVSNYSSSEVAELAGMIIRGVQDGRTLYGGKFDLGDIWSLRDAMNVGRDSTHQDTLSTERNVNFIFMLVYSPDSVNQNQLLYEMAKYNFTNFLVRNFDIAIDTDNDVHRMMISGFLSYDEALQYARNLYGNTTMTEKLSGTHRIIISQNNLPLLGVSISYKEYEDFFEQQFAPLPVSDELLLLQPEPDTDVKPTEESEPEVEEEETDNNSEDTGGELPPTDDLPFIGEPPATPAPEPPATDDTDDFGDLPDEPAPTNQQPPSIDYIEFDDDFYR